MDTERRILVVDDDQRNLEMLSEALIQAGFHVELAAGGEEAVSKGGSQDYAAVLSDIQMAPVSGMDVLESFRKTSPDTPVVLLTAFGSVDTAIQAMKHGAYDYITKPINLEELVLVASRAVEHYRLVRENRHLQSAFNERLRAASLIGQSRNMVEVFKLVGKVAPGRTSVLIHGESGTGKELIARAIHTTAPVRRGLSSRSTAARFRTRCSRVNCSVTSRGPLPAPIHSVADCWKKRVAALFSWTRWGTCLRLDRPNCCVRCKNERSDGWAATNRSRWIFG